MSAESDKLEVAAKLKTESEAKEGPLSGRSMTSTQEMQSDQLSSQLQQLNLIASTVVEGTVKATSTPLTLSDSFNTEEFLARVNKNDKICNILRAPINNSNNGVRQRSVFTTINPTSTRFNAAATPFISQTHRSNTSMGPGMPSSGGVPMGMSGKDAGLSGGGHMTQSARQMPMSMHHIHAASSHHHFSPGGYETPLTTRSGPPRAIYNSRYGNQQQQQTQMFYDNDVCRMPMPPPPFAVTRVNSFRTMEYDNMTPPPCPGAGPLAMANGTIQLRLRDGIRIDMTLDRSVRVLNQRSMVAVALSRNCSNASMIHPNGRVLQSGSKVEIVTYDGMKTNNYVRYAKMWYKGVSFTSDTCALIYLVDTAGTRTTTDSFTDLTKDYTLSVFYDDARHGPSFYKEAMEIVNASERTTTEDGSDIFDINGFRITQAADGLVKVTRNNNKCLIRTSPGNGSATLTTPGIHCTASLGKTSHLFVRRNEKRMHFDGSCFIVRNAGHSAGFNENNLLIVY